LGNEIKLTNEEKEYLKNNTFTYAGDPNWLPFEAFDDKGKYVGVIAEHVDIIENKLNLKFKKIITKHWLDTLELSKKTGADIISGDAADVVLAKHYKPIDSYMKNPLVIVTRADYPFVSDLNNFKEKKIAFGVGGGYSADILKKYPNINFINTKTPRHGLLGVKSGKYDIFIGTLAMTDYSIVDMGIEGLKVSGDTGITMNLTLFIDKDKPLLYTIINKTMSSIDEMQKHKIIVKWRHSKIDKIVVDYTLVWKIVGISVFVFLIGLVFVVILRRNNKKLHQLLNSTIEAVAIFKDGKLIDANDQLVKMYGYNSLKEIKNKTALDFVDPAQNEFVKNQLKNSQEPYELNMLRNDGTLFPSLVRGTYINANTRVSSVLDLTQLKSVQNELEELNKTLENKIRYEVEKNREKEKLMLQQSRLAQMGEIISMIAHQWRQPLNSLSMLNQSIILKYNRNKLDKEFVEYFQEKSNIQIQNMSKTIDDFRDFFKPEKEQVEFSLNAVIKDALSMVEPIFTQNKIIIKFNEKENVEFVGYPNEFGQAVLNIVNNAKDALIENSVENRIIEIVLSKTKNKVILTVRDNAGGIPEHVRDKIFDPYFSTKENSHGTGLGLYMTKIILEEHMCGKLTVIDTEYGTEFIILFNA